MSELFWLSDAAWAALEPHLPKNQPGARRVDDRRIRENGYYASFNGSMRDELLNGEIFYTLTEARILIEAWRRHYNTIRPHSALDYRPPAPERATPPWRPRQQCTTIKLDHSVGGRSSDSGKPATKRLSTNLRNNAGRSHLFRDAAPQGSSRAIEANALQAIPALR